MRSTGVVCLIVLHLTGCASSLQDGITGRTAEQVFSDLRKLRIPVLSVEGATLGKAITALQEEIGSLATDACPPIALQLSANTSIPPITLKGRYVSVLEWLFTIHNETQLSLIYDGANLVFLDSGSDDLRTYFQNSLARHTVIADDGITGVWTMHLRRDAFVQSNEVISRLVAMGITKGDSIVVYRTTADIASPESYVLGHTLVPDPDTYYVWCFSESATPAQVARSLVDVGYTNVLHIEHLRGYHGVYKTLHRPDE